MNDKVKVIALSGWKGSGKDEAAKVLVEMGYKRYAFADVLKEIVADTYNVSVDRMHNQELKERPILSLPVITTDRWSYAIHSMLKDEFAAVEFSEDSDDDDGKVIRRVQYFWTPRALCILEGSIKRSVSPFHWTSTVIREMNSTIDKGVQMKYVITDMRYRSELGQLREAYGDNLLTVRINRFDQCFSTDASERDLDDGQFDVVVYNRTTLEDFHNKIKELGED